MPETGFTRPEMKCAWFGSKPAAAVNFGLPIGLPGAKTGAALPAPPL
jgi:hypothetical protein